MFPATVRQVKRWLKIVAGFTLLGAGIVMLVTPGPGWLVILMGLALLAAEYLWARRLLAQLKSKGAQLRDAIRRSPAERPTQPKVQQLQPQVEPHSHEAAPPLPPAEHELALANQIEPVKER